MTQLTVPVAIDDAVNARILAVSEDKIQGFVRDPLGLIASRSDTPLEVVIERITAMLEAGTIRRVRQTVLSTRLAPGALVAWKVPADRLNDAFDFMFEQDPFSGHVVIRSTDKETPGSEYRLWTTIKTPLPYSVEKHCDYLAAQTGAVKYKLLPARNLFALGVGHVRRRNIEIGARTQEPARVLEVELVDLTDLEWRVMTALKREFEADEIVPDLWAARAREAGVSLDEFYRVAESLDQQRLIGRFSTFLEHVKKLRDGSTVTKYNGLFHWAVPTDRAYETGLEVGRHHIITHAYWREAGPEFNDVNIMAVAHGLDKAVLMEHKAAIDRHIEEAGIPIHYSSVFWGGRSEIKPSEISPIAYRKWCEKRGIDPDAMRQNGQTR